MLGVFEQMRGFATGRGAGIQHTQGFIGRQPAQKQRHGQLRRGVLHRKMPRFIAWQTRHIAMPRQLDTYFAKALRLHAISLQTRQ